ncbi:MAG: hypothetical protein WAL50_18080 [Kineosporiaceae bacterium]
MKELGDVSIYRVDAIQASAHAPERLSVFWIFACVVCGGRSDKTEEACEVSEISDKYVQLGGPDGFLGQPLEPEKTAQDGFGHFQHFQGGSIYWTSQTGAHEVHGAIRAKWSALGWEQGLLEYPISDETATPDGRGRYNHFQHGSVYWTPQTGAHEVHGAIRAKWSALGWERGAMGYPVTDEMGTPDGVGRFNHFEFGSIYSTDAAGTHEVHGAIRAKWSALRWEQGGLGYPVTDETVTPDGRGRYNHFQNGSIYWSPETAAHEVHGAIRGVWETLGWERSYLGYPVTDELATPGSLRCQRFQKGSIIWSPEQGVREVPGTATRYLIGVDKVRINCTRAVHEDTDHINMAVQLGDAVHNELPVKHMGDVNDGEHIVDVYYLPPFELPNLDTVVTFNYIIMNIGGDDYSAIEKGLKSGAKAGLTAAGVPGADAIIEIGAAVFHLFAANCDGPVAVDQICASGHLLEAWTGGSRIYSETRDYTYESQMFCGDSPRYQVTWSVIRL